MNKLIFISNSLVDIENIKEFAKKNNYLLEHYSKEEWNNNKHSFQKVRVKSKPANETKKYPFSIVPSLSTTDNTPQTMNEIKVEAIRHALLRSRGNASKAAEILKIGRATLYRKIKELELNLESMRQDLDEKEYTESTLVKKTA